MCVCGVCWRREGGGKGAGGEGRGGKRKGRGREETKKKKGRKKERRKKCGGLVRRRTRRRGRTSTIYEEVHKSGKWLSCILHN